MDLGNSCSAFNADEIDELKSIAKLYSNASGLVMKMAGWVGHAGEKALEKIPAEWQAKIGEATQLALRSSYWAAENSHADQSEEGMISSALSWLSGERFHKVTTGLAGATGGFGDIATTIAEIPVTTTLIMRAIQEVARGYGEDITEEAVRLQCLTVFGLGGPLTEDDDAETGFYAARMGITGKTLAEVMSKVLPRFGVPISQKVLAQATPLLGAAAGATLNTSFVSYYQTMAHVHFRLRKLEQDHPTDEVKACFERIVRTVSGKGSGPRD